MACSYKCRMSMKNVSPFIVFVAYTSNIIILVWNKIIHLLIQSS